MLGTCYICGKVLDNCIRLPSGSIVCISCVYYQGLADEEDVPELEVLEEIEEECTKACCNTCDEDCDKKDKQEQEELDFTTMRWPMSTATWMCDGYIWICDG